MRKRLLQHKLAYFFLILGLVVFALLFYYLWPNKINQRVAVVGLGVFYFLWGVMTHLKTKRLSKDIIVEYLAASLFACILLFLITL